MPRKTVIELIKLLADSDDPVAITLGANQIRFAFGGIEILRLDDAVLQSPLELAFVREDDGNPDDRTVVRVALRPFQLFQLAPGRTVRI